MLHVQFLSIACRDCRRTKHTNARYLVGCHSKARMDGGSLASNVLPLRTSSSVLFIVDDDCDDDDVERWDSKADGQVHRDHAPTYLGICSFAGCEGCALRMHIQAKWESIRSAQTQNAYNRDRAKAECISVLSSFGDYVGLDADSNVLAPRRLTIVPKCANVDLAGTSASTLGIISSLWISYWCRLSRYVLVRSVHRMRINSHKCISRKTETQTTRANQQHDKHYNMQRKRAAYSGRAHPPAPELQTKNNQAMKQFQQNTLNRHKRRRTLCSSCMLFFWLGLFTISVRWCKRNVAVAWWACAWPHAGMHHARIITMLVWTTYAVKRARGFGVVVFVYLFCVCLARSFIYSGSRRSSRVLCFALVGELVFLHLWCRIRAWGCSSVMSHPCTRLYFDISVLRLLGADMLHAWGASSNFIDNEYSSVKFQHVWVRSEWNQRQANFFRVCDNVEDLFICCEKSHFLYILALWSVYWSFRYKCMVGKCLGVDS